MAFELVVVSNTPLTPVSDLDEVGVALLRQVGYLGRGADDEANARESVAYRLFRDCFVMRPDKAWTAEELIAALGTSRPTLYRHLNKLKALDLLEESALRDEGEAGGRKAYRIRYGNLAKAWNFVEANVKVAMENYRKTVDHLHALAERSMKEGRS
ncbi:MAG TPA: helix-turn-helix domain-containing protein [Candidatus Thermoplasmatota archaeon]|nr:helix-turn-helix domain-containing protein [Candidatus Thermoplasmatota archaeon]